jgi:hypothetical protein
VCAGMRRRRVCRGRPEARYGDGHDCRAEHPQGTPARHRLDQSASEIVED